MISKKGNGEMKERRQETRKKEWRRKILVIITLTVHENFSKFADTFLVNFL